MVVSRRNFVSMLLMMAVLLFMFQFSQVIKENGSNYSVNTFIDDNEVSGENRWQSQVYGVGQGEKPDAGDYVLFLGKRKSSLYNVAAQWCEYTKRNLLVCENWEDYELQWNNLPEAVLVDSRAVELTEELDDFCKVAGYGVPLVFCNLPEPEVIRKSAGLRELLGIREVAEDVIEAEGVHLFGSFFLGGECFYLAEDEEDEKRQDLELTMPWYITASGTKTYMVGMLDELLKEEEAKNEYFPALIWRNSYRNGKVFAVNGDYMDSVQGIGILDAMMYEAGDYAVYPVINAQNVMVANFPGFSGENDQRIMELYSRDTEGVLRDIFWPAIAGMAEQGHYRPTCFLAARYRYGDGAEPSGAMVSFYLQQFKEFSTEAGLSLECRDGIDLEEKLSWDGRFYDSLEEQYAYSAVYAGEESLPELGELLEGRGFLEDVRTIAVGRGDAPIVSYYNDDITLQSATADAAFHSYGDDLWVRSVETALGYSNVLLDMYPVIWPRDEEDRWEKVSEKTSSNLNTYWKPFEVFEKTTLSESDARVRSFLNLDYEDRREEDTVYLEMSGAEEGWFILRTHGESIEQITGAEYLEIETDAYLLHVFQKEAEIRLQKSRGLLEYDLTM